MLLIVNFFNVFFFLIKSNEPPTVNDLLEDLEKKTRIPLSNIQLIFKGQKLHLHRNVPLSQFGLFSGSRIVMVGEKLNSTKDAMFRRVLGINKDVGLIEKTISDTENEFSLMQQVSFLRRKEKFLTKKIE